MIGAAVVGRRALLTSALVVTIGANIVLALASAVGLVAIGFPAGGSLALGASIGGTGIAFAGVAAVAAQITDGARTANGIAGAAIGIAFMLRAVGDVDSTVVDDGTRVVSGWMSWLSPIGWAQQIRPFDDDAWWILLLLFGFAAVHIAIAYVLIGHRDQGRGWFSRGRDHRLLRGRCRRRGSSVAHAESDDVLVAVLGGHSRIRVRGSRKRDRPVGGFVAADR